MKLFSQIVIKFPRQLRVLQLVLIKTDHYVVELKHLLDILFRFWDNEIEFFAINLNIMSLQPDDVNY